MKAEVPRIRAKQDREGHQGIACCSHDCWMESVVCFAGAWPVVVNLGLSSDKQSYVESVLEVSAVQSKMLFGASAGSRSSKSFVCSWCVEHVLSLARVRLDVGLSC